MRIAYSVPELADLTAEGASTWRHRILRREIPYMKLGSGRKGNVRVLAKDLERWLEARRVT